MNKHFIVSMKFPVCALIPKSKLMLFTRQIFLTVTFPVITSSTSLQTDWSLSYYVTMATIKCIFDRYRRTYERGRAARRRCRKLVCSQHSHIHRIQNKNAWDAEGNARRPHSVCITHCHWFIALTQCSVPLKDRWASRSGSEQTWTATVNLQFICWFIHVSCWRVTVEPLCSLNGLFGSREDD